MKRLLSLVFVLGLGLSAAVAQTRSVQLSQDTTGAILYDQTSKALTLPGVVTGPAATTVTVPAVASGTGNSVTVSAGDGVGGTSTGGSINLVPGDAVSTGIPGTLQVNGNANLICAPLTLYGAPASAVDTSFFIANRPLLLISVSQSHAVAAGGTSTATVTKDVDTEAPGAGTSLHASGTFNLNATANTVQNAVVTATVATKTFAAGNRISFKFAHAIQSSAGIVVTACFAPL